MSLIALPTVRPLPACSGMMRVVAMRGSASFQKNKRPAHHRPHRFTLYQFPRPYNTRNLLQSHLPIHPVLAWAGTEFHIVPSPGFARHPACPSSVSSATKVVLWIIDREG